MTEVKTQTLPVFEIAFSLPQEQAINEAVESAKNVDWSPLTTRPEGKLTLEFTYAIGQLFAPYLVDPQKLKTDNLVQAFPKKETDPAYGFDFLAEEVLKKLMEESGLPILCFSEENGWQRFNYTAADSPHLIAVVDPLDNSAGLKELSDNPKILLEKAGHQGVALTLADETGNFLLSAICDLQTHEIIFGEKNKKPKLLAVEGGKAIIYPDTLALRPYDGHEGIIIGSYFKKPEREAGFKKTRLAKKIKPGQYPRFLGVASLLHFLKGDAHFLIDTPKGQPWYEMPIYALIQQLGGSVIDLETNDDFSLPQLLAKAQTEDFFRVRFVAGHHPGRTKKLARILNKDLPLNQEAPKALLFG